jgi:phosphoglycolate phosphatase
MLRRCGRRFGKRAADRRLVGDSITDVETAKAAGLPCLAVTFGFRDRPAEALGATGLIDRFDQPVTALEKLKN